MNAFTDTRRVQAKAGRNLGNHTSQAKRMKAGYMLPIVSNFIGLLNGVIEAFTCLIMVDKISKLFRRFLEERRRIDDVLLEIGETTDLLSNTNFPTSSLARIYRRVILELIVLRLCSAETNRRVRKSRIII